MANTRDRLEGALQVGDLVVELVRDTIDRHIERVGGIGELTQGLDQRIVRVARPHDEIAHGIVRILEADRFFAATGARIVTGGDEAYYRPSTDTIHMPDEHLFTGTTTMTRSEGYFAVLGHEHIHWTGHGSRLDRHLSQRFGKAERAAEELVADIGSAFLCAELGITQDVRPDHAQYLAHWLQLCAAPHNFSNREVSVM